MTADYTFQATPGQVAAIERGEWPEATSPGLRVIGYRVDTYTFGFSTEYDVVAFTVGGTVEGES